MRRPRLFGGQVAAQAARAASLTVPDDRSIHSLHGYFLRAGRADRPTILHVDRDRDGRSFSARHVAARQDGEVIMSLLVSFHVDEDGPEYQALGHARRSAAARGRARAAGSSPHQSVLRPAHHRARGEPRGDWGGPPAPVLGPRARPAPRRPPAARVRAHLSLRRRDRAREAAARRPAGGGRASTTRSGSTTRRAWTTGCSSTSCPCAAAGARGFYTGTVHDRAGRLLATIAQEHVMRPHTSRVQGPEHPASQSVRKAPPSQRICAPFT